MSIPGRFWSKVDYSDDCWNWTAAKDRKGYGWFWFDKGPVRAHKYAYESVYGKVRDGLVIDHLCRNRGCVKISHMETVTNVENIRRGIVGEPNRRKTACPRGHEYDTKNTIISSNGRGCRTCSNDRKRAKRKAVHV